MLKIEDFRFSSSSIDDFYSPPNFIKVAKSNRIRIASASDLNGFIKLSSNKLVHVSNQDFWKLSQDEGGDYFIERIMDDSEGPVRG